MGYADGGEEDDWTRAPESPEQPAKAKKHSKTGDARSGAPYFHVLQQAPLESSQPVHRPACSWDTHQRAGCVMVLHQS